MKDFLELVATRRSIRKFKEENLTQEEAEQILKAGLFSPTSKGENSWDFVAVENKEVLSALSESKPNFAHFIAGCSMAVVLVGDEEECDAWIEDASIAAISMQLEAEDLGLGSCWVQIRGRKRIDDTDSEEYVKELLGIPEEKRVLCILAFGRKEKELRPHKESELLWEKVHIGKW